MNKPCAKCNRVVYSMEQLKCLDQVWHKGCFNCDVCNTKLTMKNYKGYDKRPYCNAHYPTTKFTQVADNPEMRRVKANTKTISNIEYHRDLEEQKGKKISVESDPVIDKAKKNTRIQSNLVYHGHEKTREFENAHRPPVEKSKQPVKAEYNPMRDLQEAIGNEWAQPAGGYGHAGGYTAKGGTRYVALYDYTAADHDEVSFVEGDFIINPEIIDDGWMTGTVESTGRTGMLPSNYVEKA